MHADLTPIENARLRRLALARAAELRGQALHGIWAAPGRWAARLFRHLVPARGRPPQIRLG